MRKAVAEDKQSVIDILVRSFHDNPSVNYVIKQDRHREKRLAALMDYSFELCMSFGEIWINDEKTGCGLLLYPSQRVTNIRTIMLDLRLVLTSIGIFRFPMILKRESQIKRRHPPGELTYLWFIGVRPEHQRQRIGSSILQKVIERSVAANRPIVLETSVPGNVTWYETFGFEVFGKIDLSYTLYLLKKAPSTS
jgi:ribosomal protein S18 acetylase RimI-like enzyme